MVKGLPNLGNTCYFNAALQCLLQVPILTNYFLQVGDLSTDFVSEYQRIARQYWSDDQGVIDTRRLFQLFTERYKQFQGYDQQDAQEVVMCMLDLFDQTLIKSIFGGRVTQETLCPSGKSKLEEDFYSIVLYPSRNCSVSEALEEHQKYVTIPEYTDAKGKTHHVSVSRTLLTRVPRVLIVTLQGRRLIRLEDQLCGKELFALICHVGDESGGHYVAFTKHKSDWFYKNDLHVTTEAPPEWAYYYLAIYK
jgi:uncharacterized UBP type Zn finger protein